MGKTETNAHCDHLVQVYRHSADLAHTAATFLAAGFDAQEPGIAIATAAHWQLISDRLAQRGWNVGELQQDGLLFVRDAATTLAALGDGSALSSKRFYEIVGGLLQEAAGTDPPRRVRAFGEMVDLLVRRGEQTAADVLEGYWNELAEKRNFTLLCGYKLDLLDLDVQRDLLPQVHRSHAQVLPAADDAQFAAAVERALTDVLGESDATKVLAQSARAQIDAPASQLALIWVTAHMPRAAAQILATARTHYTASAAA